MSKILDELVILLRPQMKEMNFKNDRSSNFLRDEVDRVELILLGSRKDIPSGEEKCSINVGIRYPQIEAILDPDAGDGSRPTVGMPVHLLTEERLFWEWSLNSMTIETTRDDVVEKIRRYALPFFASFGSVGAIAEKLSKDEPAKWFSMTPTRRAEVLTACLLVLNNADAAKSFLQSQIELNRDKLPKYRIPLQLLQQRLFKEG